MKTIRRFCELYEQGPSYSPHSSRMRSEQTCLLELLYTDAIASYLSLPHGHWWHGRGMTGMFTSSLPLSQSTLCTSNVLMCLPIQRPRHNGLNHRLSGIRTPRKNRFLVDRIPGVQWVIFIALGWNLACFQSWNSKRPRNPGGFVHSPAFWKQRPESAVNQNTTWREWCCIALPKRIVSVLVGKFI
jgi:hypothetical protein